LFQEGVITLLPKKIEGEATTLGLLRILNSRRMTRNVASTENLSSSNQTTYSSFKRKGLFEDILANIREALASFHPINSFSKRELTEIEQLKKLNFLLSFLSECYIYYFLFSNKYFFSNNIIFMNCRCFSLNNWFWPPTRTACRKNNLFFHSRRLLGILWLWGNSWKAVYKFSKQNDFIRTLQRCFS